MNLTVIVFSLLVLTLFPFAMQDGFAQCILSPKICFDSLELSLKEQLGGHVKWTGITCPNNDHVLTERPNGKHACITTNMAEKMKWNLVYDRTEWMLGEYYISIKLDDIVLEHIRADHDKQKILLSATVEDDANLGTLEFTFPKKAASMIFDNDNCSVFDYLSGTPKFNLIINQEPQKTLDAFYLAIDGTHSPDRMVLSIPVSADSGLVELSSPCSVQVPFLDEILTISDTEDFIRYATSGHTKIIDGIIDEEYELLLIMMNPSSAGDLTIELPRDVIDAKGDFCPPKLEFPEDGTFIVLENGAEIDFEEILTMPEKRILTIPFNENTSEIEIIGPCLI